MPSTYARALLHRTVGFVVVSVVAVSLVARSRRTSSRAAMVYVAVGVVWLLVRDELNLALRTGCVAPPRRREEEEEEGEKEAPPQPYRTVVGSGWSFFLQQRAAPCDFLRVRRGPAARPGWWYAGSTIGEVQRALRARGLTLSAHPSVQNGTLGGWIASGSHGSGGTLWRPNFGALRILDQATGDTSEVAAFPDDDDARRYAILEVELTPHPDAWCRKRVFKANTVDDYETWLRAPSYLRLLQVGRRGVMALLWEPMDPERDARLREDPRVGSMLGLWLQSDILSILQSDAARHAPWFVFPVGSRATFQSRIRLSDANHYTMEPTTLTTPIGLAFVNYEAFLHDVSLDGATLRRLCERLADVFAADVRGRCEIRYGGAKLMLDLNVARWTPHHRAIFEAVRDVLGDDVRVRLHRGKSDVDTAPLQRA
jgi:hypothetical protein